MSQSDYVVQQQLLGLYKHVNTLRKLSIMNSIAIILIALGTLLR